MSGTLSENDWDRLIPRIKKGLCTPFLGAGACAGVLPLGADIARDWAAAYGFPFENTWDLIKVAQFLAVEYDNNFPKERLQEKFEGVKPPNFREPDEPHGLLAELPLPVYLTTNYDDFMTQALKGRFRDPRRELCRWNDRLEDVPSVFEAEPGYQPTVANPIVFHLHGLLRPDDPTIVRSLVLTEDDYLEFLGNISRAGELIPPRIQQALRNSSLLFIGYGIADWNFRVLYQSLRSFGQFAGVAVLKPPAGGDEAKLAKSMEYFDKSFRAMDLKVYWGTAREFSAELRRRWTAAGG